MGLFDFLKPDPIAKFQKENKKLLLSVELEYVTKQVSNLRAVGRAPDADKAAKEYIRKVLELFKEQPDHPEHLTYMASVALNLGVPKEAEIILQAVIETAAEFPVVDLTYVYLDLGRVYHRLHVPPEKELDCYLKAIAAKAPPKAKQVASQRMKAKVHLFAIGAANRAFKFDQVNYHKAEFKRLAPDVNVDDPVAHVTFVKETQA